MNLKVKLLTTTAKLPTRGTSGAAGLDLYWNGLIGELDVQYPDWVFGGGEVVEFRTGIAVDIAPGYVGLLRERSGLGRRGVTLHGGVIDSDFRGEIIVMLSSLRPIEIKAGNRIAQLLIVPCPQLEVVEVAELDETERGAGGFGSTGR